LVIFYGDATSERRLKKRPVRIGRRPPPDGVEKRLQSLRRVPTGDLGQSRPFQDPRPRFQFPQDSQAFPERVFVERPESDEMLLRISCRRECRGLNVTHDPLSTPHLHQLARIGCEATRDIIGRLGSCFIRHVRSLRLFCFFVSLTTNRRVPGCSGQ
jgi:hypothetical protein